MDQLCRCYFKRLKANCGWYGDVKKFDFWTEVKRKKITDENNFIKWSGARVIDIEKVLTIKAGCKNGSGESFPDAENRYGFEPAK